MEKVYSILIGGFLLLILYIGIDQSIKNSKPYSSVDTKELLEKIILVNNYIIIDTRTEDEYEKEHVVGAINIPYNKIEECVGSYSELNEKGIIVYSRDKKESNLAFIKLIKLGYRGLDIGSYDTITLEKE